jgi:hypothetical protein
VGVRRHLLVKVKSITFLGAILCLVPNIARAQQTCEHRILVLPQTHASVIRGSLEVVDLEETALSQFKVAKYIESHRQTPIFSEQFGVTTTPKLLPGLYESPLVKEYMEQFVDGLPQTYAALTIGQKTKLARGGGDFVAMLLGLVETVYGTTESNEIQDKKFEAISEWIKNHPEVKTIRQGSKIHRIIFEERDLLALAEINKFFAAHPEQKEVLLIFGARHNFAQYPFAFPSECIVKVDIQ